MMFVAMSRIAKCTYRLNPALSKVQRYAVDTYVVRNRMLRALIVKDGASDVVKSLLPSSTTPLVLRVEQLW